MVRLKSTMVVAVAVAALAACGGGSGSGGTSGNGAASASGGASVKTIKEGTLTIGTNLPFAPLGFYEADGKTMTGAEIDLMRAVAEQMGLKVDIQNTAWDGLIPAAKANRYDAVWASIGDYTERRTQIDFVDYLSVRSAVTVRTEDAAKYKSEMDLCGQKAGATKGASTVTTLQKFSDACVKAGKPAINISQFPSTAEGLTALRSKRIDAECMDGPVAVYKATVDKSVFSIALPAVGPNTLYGIGVGQQNQGLRDAIKVALQALIDNGKYKQILDKYGLAQYAVTEATVNKGGSKAS